MENDPYAPTNKVDGLKPIEGKGVDFSEFEGQKKKIEVVEVSDTTTPYDEEGNYKEGLKRPIKVLRVATEKVTTIPTDEGDKDIHASELFNLKKDPETGEWGYPTGKRSKILNFMKKMKVEHPKDLKGKEVILKVRKKAGSDNEFLGFYTEN